MNNAELITALRYCTDNEKQDGCDECPYLHNGMCHTMLSDAAYALEAADKRIARLEEDLKTREAEREVMQDTIKVCEKRIAELEKYCRECEEIACHYM